MSILLNFIRVLSDTKGVKTMQYVTKFRSLSFAVVSSFLLIHVHAQQNTEDNKNSAVAQPGIGAGTISKGLGGGSFSVGAPRAGSMGSQPPTAGSMGSGTIRAGSMGVVTGPPSGGSFSSKRLGGGSLTNNPSGTRLYSVPAKTTPVPQAASTPVPLTSTPQQTESESSPTNSKPKPKTTFQWQ